MRYVKTVLAWWPLWVWVTLFVVGCDDCPTCTPLPPEQKYEQLRTYDGVLITASKFDFEGHRYITFNGRDAFRYGVVHDPACPCQARAPEAK